MAPVTQNMTAGAMNTLHGMEIGKEPDSPDGTAKKNKTRKSTDSDQHYYYT